MLLESLPSFNATPSGCKPWPEKLALFNGNFWGLSLKVLLAWLLHTHTYTHNMFL